MKIRDDKAAVDKDWETWKHLLASDLKQVKNQVRNDSTGEEGRGTCSFRTPHGPLLSQTLQARKTILNIHGESRASKIDIVEEDTGYRAVFTEYEASASQMAAPRFLVTLSRRFGMTGDAIDAVTA